MFICLTKEGRLALGIYPYLDFIKWGIYSLYHSLNWSQTWLIILEHSGCMHQEFYYFLLNIFLTFEGKKNTLASASFSTYLRNLSVQCQNVVCCISRGSNYKIGTF